jgi:predicted TIM-barrel fold metal-dependent hydrolase
VTEETSSVVGRSRDPEPVAATRAFWQDLGLPGLFDAHVHFLPPRLQAKVWAQFDEAGPKIGRPWPIRYRDSHEDRVELLRSFGVRAFPTLPYAHRPGIATWLNEWSAEFAAEIGECLWSGTFYPEPEAAAYVGELVGAGVEVFKLHTQVGEFALDDPLLDEPFGILEDAGTPVVIHVGSGPVGNEWTGPDHLARLLQRHPRLTAIVAHMGAPEYDEFLALAETHEHLRLDTTMVFTGFFDEAAPYPDDLLPRLAALGDRVLFGSDFPTIPYPYLDQLEGLARVAGRHPDLGEEWLRRVCWHNAVELWGEPS